MCRISEKKKFIWIFFEFSCCIPSSPQLMLAHQCAIRYYKYIYISILATFSSFSIFRNDQLSYLHGIIACQTPYLRQSLSNRNTHYSSLWAGNVYMEFSVCCAKNDWIGGIVAYTKWEKLPPNVVMVMCST